MEVLDWREHPTGSVVKTTPVRSLKDLESAMSGDASNPAEVERLWNELVTARTALVERLSTMDDEVVEDFLEVDGEHMNVGDDVLRKALRRVTLSGKGVPVLCGAAFRNAGVQPVMDAVLDYLPSPRERPAPVGILPGGEKNLVPIDGGHVCALAFKVIHDQRRGALVFVRVYSGSIEPRAMLYNSTQKVKERAGKILQMYADDFEEIPRVTAGNIACIVGLSETRTGDTLLLASEVDTSASAVSGTANTPAAKKGHQKASSVVKHPAVQLDTIPIPPPVFVRSVEPESGADERKLEASLAALVREDPSLDISSDAETGQTLVGGMGELHLEIAAERLKDTHQCKAKMGKVMISYRETVDVAAGPVSAEFVYDRDLFGKRAKAEVEVVVEALKKGDEEDSDGGMGDGHPPPLANGRPSKPIAPSGYPSLREIHEALEEGLKGGLARGPLLGCPVANVKVTCTRLQLTSPELSTLAAIRAAVSRCLTDAMRGGSAGVNSAEGRKNIPCKLMEPVMSVSIRVPEKYVGAVTKDLTGTRRGEVLALGPASGDFGVDDAGEISGDVGQNVDGSLMAELNGGSGGVGGTNDVLQSSVIIETRVPLSSLLGYSTTLRGLTAGTGEFSMKLLGYGMMSSDREEAVIKEIRVVKKPAASTAVATSEAAPAPAKVVKALPPPPRKRMGVMKKKISPSTLGAKGKNKIRSKTKSSEVEDFEFPDDPAAWLPSDAEDDDIDNDDQNESVPEETQQPKSTDDKKKNKNKNKKNQKNDGDATSSLGKRKRPEAENENDVNASFDEADLVDKEGDVIYNDPDALPMDKLEWKEVEVPQGMFLAPSDKDGPGGFLCLEELDGVEVDIVEGMSGGKMVKFKKSKKAKATPKAKAPKDHRKAANPEAPLPESETAHFIHVDDFDEKLIVKETAKGKKASKEPVTAPTGEADNADVEMADAEVTIGDSSEKERQVVKRAPDGELVEPTRRERKASKKDAAVKAVAAAQQSKAALEEARAKMEEAQVSMDTEMGDDGQTKQQQDKKKHHQHENDIDPSIIAWKPFRLRPVLLRAIQERGFLQPTEIQVLALRAALDTTRRGNGVSSGKDIVGAAATGSGKTLAFGIPILQAIAIRDEEEGYVPREEEPEVEVQGEGEGGDGEGMNEDEVEKDEEANGEADVGEDEEEKDSGDIEPAATAAKKSTWKPRLRPCLAVILTPTRELAMQVTDHLKAISKYTSARIASIVGGMSAEKQRRVLSKHPDIIVATPGRLWELASEDDTILQSLRCVKYFILDEADRMLESGHFKDLDNIMRAISLKRTDDNVANLNPVFLPPATRQTFVFSATLTDDANISAKLVSKKKQNPKQKNKQTITDILNRLELNDAPIHINALTSNMLAEGLIETRVDCLAEDKDAVLYYILLKYPGRTVVFVNSIDSVRRLVPVLGMMGVQAFGLHAEMQQRQRLKNLDRFRENSSTVLVASDVAARGLDIPAVEHVVHYQLPRTAELYIHRSGRTARANKEGLSVMLCGPAEVQVYKKICFALGKTDGLPEFPVDRSILSALRSRLSLAKKIEAEEHKLRKDKSEKDWFRKAAEEADIELDMSDFESDDDSKKPKKRNNREDEKTKAKLASLRAELNVLLQTPLLPSGVTSKYITSGAEREFAETVIKGDGNKILPGHRQQKAVQDVKDGPKSKKLKKA
ncbi:ATP-dependent RNA helicase [Blyttiomyces sp. JEL0837]|nr:ATP-dependent RNA helicase [Blyttiomyces sp. JEL0837]